MRKLPPPEIKASEVTELCASSIQDSDLSERLLDATQSIKDAEDQYIEFGQASKLYDITAAENVGAVSASEMKRVYEGTFVVSRKTRFIYDQIKKMPVNDICPSCGQRTVSTLDHYLPKANYAALAITPTNLIPCCRECNGLKATQSADCAEEQILHPYFDDFDDECWLYAEVIESVPASLRFFANPPCSWDEEKQKRIIFHFDLLQLGALYASHSAEELVSIRYGLNKILASTGPAGVRTDLQDTYESKSHAHINSWRTAMYRAMASSDWFCSGGFKLT